MIDGIQEGRGYVIDESHPPLFFAAMHGKADVLEHGIWQLEQSGRDVSPIVIESLSRTLVVNRYDPEPVTVQVVQHGGPLERVTEILGAGIGLGVLGEVRRTAVALDLQLAPLTECFAKRIATERTTLLQTYVLFRGDPAEKRRRLAQVLRGLQEKYRRDMNLLRNLL